MFEQEFADDPRPRQAIEAARAWARRKIAVSEAKAAALAAHEAARQADHAVARAAARSAGHAAETAHVPEHGRHAATYARSAAKGAASAKYSGLAAARERDWQAEQLLQRLRPLVFGDGAEK